MKIIKIILLLFPVVVFGQIEPIQLQPSTKENGIIKATQKVYDEWTGDTIWYYTHDSLIADSIYIVNDTIKLRDGSGFVVIPEGNEGTVKGSGTATRIPFWAGSDSLSSNANLYWDNTNSRLGLGLTSPNQQLELTGSFRTPATTSSTTGVWYKGTTRFIHNFQHPTGGGAVPAGGNTFIGIDAGNFTMGSTATSTTQSSYNVGIGDRTLLNNTTGYQNIALGYGVLLNNTTGSQNSGYGIGTLANNIDGYRNNAFGYGALNANTSGYENTAIGQISLWANTSGYLNTSIGRSSLVANTTGYTNTSIGVYSLAGNTTGHSNIAIGSNAGRYLSNGSTAKETGNYGIYIGVNTKASDNALSNEIVFGYNAIGNGSNTITLGGSTITKTYIPYGGLRLSGLSTSTETAAVMIDSNKDLSYRTLNAGAFSGYSAGFGLGLTGTTFSNTRYWSGQDTLKTTLSGLVKATSGVLTAITDNSSNWNTAYGWGNHASAGYLTSETGDISAVSATSPLTGGGTSGAVTIGITNADANGSTKGAASFTANDFNASSGNISIDYTNGQAATGSTKGFLTSTDWSTFNSKYTLPSSTTGYIPYYSSSTALGSESNLFWDAANDRLGIGTATPSNQFTVYKSGSALGLIEGTTVGALEVKGGTYSGYTLSHGTGNYYMQYQVGTGYGLRFFPDVDQPSMPIRFQTWQNSDRFVINPSANQIGVYDGTSIDYGSTGEYLSKTASGYAWVTIPDQTPIIRFAKLHITGGSQTITAGNTTKVLYSNETDPWSPDPDASATNERITVNQNAFYEVDVNVQGKYSGGSSTLSICIYKNGSQIWEYKLHAVSDNDHSNQVNNIFSLASGDYVEVFVKATTLNYTINQSTFIVKKIAY